MQVINLRTLKPIDRDAIVDSVKKTHRLLVCRRLSSSTSLLVYRVQKQTGFWHRPRLQNCGLDDTSSCISTPAVASDVAV